MKYFAYGMNTNLSSMAARCPGAQSLGAATLLNHKFRFAVHADVTEQENENVNGVLWEIDGSHLTSLDCLEGYPHYYDRKTVEVLHNGKTVSAITYFMQPGNQHNHPSTGYFDMVLEGYKENLVPVRQLHEAIKEIENLNQGVVYEYL